VCRVATPRRSNGINVTPNYHIMKFFETTFDHHIKSVQKVNLHPELLPIWKTMPPPSGLVLFPNMIFYGPSGVGKYTQMLYCIHRYSACELKINKKISIQFNKQNYTYHISDIHYEIDMALLGCNSKLLWHDIFCQIVDIISVKTEKIGIIVCKNFHAIHNELLEIFYSYMQQYNSLAHSNILVKFILVTENISFIPNHIINTCYMVRVARPNYGLILPPTAAAAAMHPPVTNIKELLSQTAAAAAVVADTPQKSFFLICNTIIKQILDYKNLSFTVFRDTIYDIFIYNLDVAECIWYIVTEIIRKNVISNKGITNIIIKSYTFLQYFNNNYRPIYHLESFFIYIIIQYNESIAGV
jgi:hypothetical protein